MDAKEVTDEMITAQQQMMISLNSNLAPTMLYSNPIKFIPAIRATRFKGHLFIIIKMQ